MERPNESSVPRKRRAFPILGKTRKRLLPLHDFTSVPLPSSSESGSMEQEEVENLVVNGTVCHGTALGRLTSGNVLR
jgi:hypothetical protein